MHKPVTPRAMVAARVLLVLLIIACGGGSPATTAPLQTASASPSATATTASAPPTATQAPDDNPVAAALAWLVGLGPGAPAGPDEVDVYQLILEGSEDNCRLAFQTEMARSAELYHGAAAACLAALHGRSQRWTDAESALDALDAPPEGCLDRQIYDLLQFAVNAYRADPQTRFRLDRSDNTVAQRCPTISDLSVSRDAGGNLEIRVQGDRLGRVLVLRYKFVEGCPVPVDTPDTESVELVDQTRESVRAVLDTVVVPADAAFIWVGLVAAPDPWIADGTCIPIDGAAPSEAPLDASPTPTA